jgi:hypothetical protein
MGKIEPVNQWKKYKYIGSRELVCGAAASRQWRWMKWRCGSVGRWSYGSWTSKLIENKRKRLLGKSTIWSDQAVPHRSRWTWQRNGGLSLGRDSDSGDVVDEALTCSVLLPRGCVTSLSVKETARSSLVAAFNGGNGFMCSRRRVRRAGAGCAEHE